ncbi:LamG domain-containing protein [Pedobacter sp. BS3]|uniref:LamG domain-containing protein n=1 Tax=Pedobacter sp. BS3 TaxID=2567937 RepID=UPI0011EF2C2E|nr:LamG domain-containing protein [Pedobacter sp. BS3]TZF83158.1 LamG domain-containing protein [Pedobacter sp. BS3]
MKRLNSYIGRLAYSTAVCALLFSSCKKSDNPNNLPGVDPAAYEGKVDGYDNSEQIYPGHLKAYWSFDDTKNEIKSGTAPTQTANDAFITGVRGKAIKLSAGYLYYAKQFGAFKTDSLKNFTISVWIQITNNGSKKTMVMQLARPGIFDGSLDFRLNTNSYPASNTDILKVAPRFTTVGGGSQDNLNATLSPKIGANVWTHLVLTYDSTSGTFKEWANGVDIGSYNSRGTGNNLFKAYEPGEFIIGGNYNVIPGKAVSTNADFAAMTGSIDEIRIYDMVLPDAHIKALYNLGLAGK